MRAMSEARRVVLITGASSGIGRACADRLAGAKFAVYGTSRDPDRLEPDSIDWVPVRMDVTDTRSVGEGVEAILRSCGTIDVLINNAGVGLAGAIEETSVEEALALLQTDFLGVLRTCRAVLPSMRARRVGVIVNVSSLAGRIGLPFQGLYSAAKFAVEGLSEALRLELRPFGVRVVLVEPGDICTPFTEHRRFVCSESESPYVERMARVIRRAEDDERAGPDPEIVARLVARIVGARAPRARYTVGPAFQRIAGQLKALLPDGLFELFLATYYRLR